MPCEMIGSLGLNQGTSGPSCLELFFRCCGVGFINYRMVSSAKKIYGSNNKVFKNTICQPGVPYFFRQEKIIFFCFRIIFLLVEQTL